MGSIILFEGNRGEQDVVDRFSDDASFSRRPKENDEARSLILENVLQHSMIELFDSSNGEYGNHCVIFILQSHPRYVVESFNSSFADSYVAVKYVPRRGQDKPGLDGKVSLIRYHQNGIERLM